MQITKLFTVIYYDVLLSYTYKYATPDVKSDDLSTIADVNECQVDTSKK